MGERCELFLGKGVYCPGEAIHGRVECHFMHENKVRGIRVRFKGAAKTYWSEGRNQSYQAEEVYFEMESDLLLSETTFLPGIYSYPFSFHLPNDIPSSIDESYGSIKYTVYATIDRPWMVDYSYKEVFTVYSPNNFTKLIGLENSAIFSQEKIPYSLFTESGAIKIFVNLPKNGYFPSQMISFAARVKNESNIKVQEVRFKITQGFKFFAKDEKKIEESMSGQEFAIIDSSIAPRNENSWNLELRVPEDMFVGSLGRCTIIKTYWELQGEVCLPFPYYNFKIHVPLILGASQLP